MSSRKPSRRKKEVSNSFVGRDVPRPPLPPSGVPYGYHPGGAVVMAGGTTVEQLLGRLDSSTYKRLCGAAERADLSLSDMILLALREWDLHRAWVERQESFKGGKEA